MLRIFMLFFVIFLSSCSNYKKYSPKKPNEMKHFIAINNISEIEKE